MFKLHIRQIILFSPNKTIMKRFFIAITLASISFGASAQHLMLVDGQVQEMPQQKQDYSRQSQLEKEQNTREQEMQSRMQQMRSPQHVRSLAKGKYVERFDKYECETYRCINEYAENGDFVMTNSWKEDGAWRNTTKYEYTYDGNGNEKTYTTYFWSEGAWIPNRRSEYLQYDANGHSTQWNEYSWKDENWMLTAKHNSEYYESGQQSLSYTEYYTDGILTSSSKYEYFEDGQYASSSYDTYTEGILKSSSKYEYYKNGKTKYIYYLSEWSGESESWYDENGNKTIWTERVSDYETTNVCRMKHNTTYNEKNLEETDMLYMWVATDWKLVGKTEYKYDRQDRMTEKFYYAKDGDSWTLTSGPIYIWEDGTRSNRGPIYSYKYDFTKFENDSHELEEKCQGYYYLNYWMYDSNSSYMMKYNANNQIVLEEHYSYKNTYEYDAQGNLRSEYRYTGSVGQWQAESKKLYTYDADGNKSKYEYWSWDGKMYEWILSEIEEYAHGLLTLKCKMYYDNIGYKTEYTYDEKGLLRSEIGYTRTDGEWTPSTKYEYTDYYYSLNSPSKPYDSNYWTYVDGEWKLGMYNDRTFDDRGNVLESTTYTSWGGYFHRVYTYDYSIDPTQIWGWTGGTKVLSIVETNLETNEVNHVKYYYSSLGESAVQSVENDATDNQTIYDIAGRRMYNLQKGINIVNKKKIVLK